MAVCRIDLLSFRHFSRNFDTNRDGERTVIYFPVGRRLDSAAAAHHPGKAGSALLPQIVVLALRGTIAMTNNQGAAGVQPSSTAADLVAGVPPLAATPEGEGRSIRSAP